MTSGNSSISLALEALVEAYANMQVEACRSPQLLSETPSLDLATLLPRLLKFLDPEAESTPTSGRYILGRSSCASYHAALARRADLLGALLNEAGRLPVTINDGRLQAETILQQESKTLLPTDGDKTLAGPAGLSLYALFDGCAAPAALLGSGDELNLAGQQRHKLSVLTRYMDALAALDYASRTELEQCLPGAICAGAICSLLRCADHHDTSNDYRKRVARHMQTRLSDLLDLCDLLALNDRNSVLRCARDYYDNDRRWRAERILRGYLAREKNDTEVLSRLARLLHKRQKRTEAINVFQKALALDPANALWHEQLGDVLVEKLHLDQARSSFEQALRDGGSAARIQPRLEWVDELQRCEEDVQRDAVVPTLTLTESELRSKKWLAEHLALGVKLFHQYGVLLIHHAFNESLIEACHAEFIQRYAEYYAAKTHANALRIGDKRFQISVALEGVFNDPGLYANPFILAIMRRLLGDEFVLGCTVCATSLPGAKVQHLHKDHRALFAKNADDPPMRLPPFAITTMLPLVTLDEKIGTTSVKKGSHLLSQPDSIALPEQLPMVPLGSCFLMDMRLSHKGLANQTDRVRPIMNMVYQRYWFADSRNFEKHPPLRVSASEYKRIPKENRRLFDWGTQPGPQVKR